MKLTTAQIGKMGELLVQYKLLGYGIESSRMTTDYGIDLIAFSAKEQKAITIQVKTNRKPKAGGGSGKMALDWWLPDKSPADFAALVDLSSENIWIFTMKEFKENAQQHSNGRSHFYMYVDHKAISRKHKKYLDIHFEEFQLDNKIDKLFI